MSCGHMDGVSAEKGPPGVGMNSDTVPVYSGEAATLRPSPVATTMSSSSSERVSAVQDTNILKSHCVNTTPHTVT